MPCIVASPADEVCSSRCDWLSRGGNSPGRGVEFHFAEIFFFSASVLAAAGGDAKVEPDTVIVRSVALATAQNVLVQWSNNISGIFFMFFFF